MTTFTGETIQSLDSLVTRKLASTNEEAVDVAEYYRKKAAQIALEVGTTKSLKAEAEDAPFQYRIAVQALTQEIVKALLEM